MKIMTKVVTSGSLYLARFPEFNLEIKDVCDNGKINRIKIRAALAGWDELGYITWGDDSDAVVAFSVEFMRHMTNCFKGAVVDSDEDDENAAETPRVERMMKRVDGGKNAFTRLTITSNRRGIRVRMEIANPYNIVGPIMKSCREYAVDQARILLYLKREIEKDGERGEFISLEGVGEIADIFEEAAWMERRSDDRKLVKAANEKRVACPNRCGDFCSPACPDCRCYSAGRCGTADLKPEYQGTFQDHKNNNTKGK